MKQLLALLSLCLLSQLAFGQPVKAGDLTVDGGWARSTAAQAQNGAAYLQISNHGANADQLLSVHSEAAAQAQIHQTSMDNGIMRMREVEGGLTIPAGQQVRFAPGGLHVMLMGLKAPLQNGQHLTLVLQFAHAGKVKVVIPVQDQPTSANGKMLMSTPMQMN